MNCQIKTYLDPNSKIFYKVYKGEVELEDIFNSWEDLFREKKLTGNSHKILIDYTDAIILFPPENAVEIAIFYKKHDSIFANSRIAMVMVTPKQAVFPHLVELEKINFKINLFSTEKAALRWLND